MEYVAWYMIITGVTTLSATALFCVCGYWTPTLYAEDRDYVQDYMEYLKLEHKRLEEYWMWRREEDD